MTHWNCGISLNKNVLKFNSSPLKNDALEDFLLSFWDGTLPETNSSPLKNGGWKTFTFPFGFRLDFQVRKMLVSGAKFTCQRWLTCPRLDLFQTSNVRGLKVSFLKTMLKLMQINSSSFWSWRIPFFLVDTFSNMSDLSAEKMTLTTYLYRMEGKLSKMQM